MVWSSAWSSVLGVDYATTAKSIRIISIFHGHVRLDQSEALDLRPQCRYEQCADVAAGGRMDEEVDEVRARRVSTVLKP